MRRRHPTGVMPDHPAASHLRTVLRFWLKLGALIVLGGLAALIVFLIIGAALLTWGIVGGIIVFGAILIGFAWLLDRREAEKRREWEEELTA